MIILKFIALISRVDMGVEFVSPFLMEIVNNPVKAVAMIVNNWATMEI